MVAVGPVPGQPAREAVRVFYSSDPGGGLRMRSSVDGGATWGAPVTAAEGTYADVAIDRAGRVHVAVSLSDPSGAGAWGSTENQVAYAVSRDGETFARPVAVSAPGESIPFFFVNPTIAVDGEPRGACAPSVRASDDMAAYELVRHSSKWLGGYEALLVDPKRRVLHSVWTHTVQEGEHAIARLRHATRPLSPAR
jgi:hypothetical protein